MLTLNSISGMTFDKLLKWKIIRAPYYKADIYGKGNSYQTVFKVKETLELVAKPERSLGI